MDIVKETEIVDRELYRKIKQMDRKELNSFINKIYNMGVSDAGCSLITVENIEKEISSVPGIGEKRLQKIMNKLKPLFKANKSSEN